MLTPALPRFRPGRRVLVFTAALALAAVLAYCELSTPPWLWLAKTLENAPPGFFLPLDTQSRGVQAGFETDPVGQTILWGYGPGSSLRFTTYAPMHLRLCYALSSPIRDQRVDVAQNGRPLAAYGGPNQPTLPNDAGHPVCHDFISKAGENTLQFDYRLWNHGGNAYAADDPRQLAVSFTMLQLLPSPAPAP